MLFSDFAKRLEILEQTNSRLEMMYQLSDAYKSFEKDEIKVASYLMQGSLVPAYLSLEFQLSVKMVIRALAQLYAEYSRDSGSGVSLFGEVDDSSSVQQVTKLYKSSGDVGIVAFEVVTGWLKTDSAKQKNSVSVVQVYEKLVEIAQEGGAGSQDRKLQKLVELLKSSDPISAKFITRIIVGKLRLGFSAMTILDALSWAVAGSKTHRVLLENAYQNRADTGELAQVYLQLAADEHNDLSAIEKKLDEKYEVATGIPVVPALCQRLNSAHEIIEKMGTVIAEPKYDGLRVQIHYSKKGFENGTHIRAFTRNLDEVTHMFPELSQLDSVLKVAECVLDSEAIGYDPKTEKLLPFQETITRKRKHDVGEASEKVPIRFFVFDVLSSGNNSLIKKTLRERKELLKDIIKENRTIKITDYITTADPTKLHSFHEKKLQEGLEGAVIKQIDSHYQSGRKGWSWVKIKESEGSSGKLKDTLDLVVMGYYVGRGKRSQFGVGAFLVGVINEKQEVKTIAKIGTGLSDEQFRELKQRGDTLAVKMQPKEYEVEKSLIPDMWMRPELVVEIAADEITKSPTHSAKVALRFPRLVGFRDDKNWTDATTITELKNF
ncbi:MAG: putative DNA ligase [Patescibacteria group bacterium]|nr:MAG: putative DNA ligase [Patescibacteria group bacterium]